LTEERNGLAGDLQTARQEVGTAVGEKVIFSGELDQLRRDVAKERERWGAEKKSLSDAKIKSRTSPENSKT